MVELPSDLVRAWVSKERRSEVSVFEILRKAHLSSMGGKEGPCMIGW